MCPSHPGTHEYHIPPQYAHPVLAPGRRGTYTACGRLNRPPVTALAVAHTSIIGRVLDIPSPLSASRIWVRVRVSGRRCYRFSGLCAFHLSGDVAVGTRRPRIAVLAAYNATASSTLALLQGRGRLVHHIRSKSTYEDETGG